MSSCSCLPPELEAHPVSDAGDDPFDFHVFGLASGLPEAGGAQGPAVLGVGGDGVVLRAGHPSVPSKIVGTSDSSARAARVFGSSTYSASRSRSAPGTRASP